MRVDQDSENSTVENLSESVSDILNNMSQKTLGDTNVAVFIGKGTAKVNSSFAILFYESLLDRVITNELSATDIKVLLCILKYVYKGNVVNISQQEIAADLFIKRQQVSRAYGRLIKSELLLVSAKGSIFLNPQVVAKEALKNMKKTPAYQMAVNMLPKNKVNY
jgi:CRP-like cAMP-binding protein